MKYPVIPFAVLACLLALAGCGPIFAHDASAGPGSDSAAASAVRGRALSGQYQ